MAELKVSPIASRLRASILQQAVEGKLVPQDPTEGTADELLEQIREQRAELVKQKKAKAPKGGESRIYQSADGSWYEQRGKGEPKCIDNEIPFDIPESWAWARLDSVASVKTGLGYKKPDLQVQSERKIRILRGGNITSNGSVVLKDDDIRIAEQFVDSSLLLEPGQIITPAVTSLENVGKCALIREALPDTVCGGFVFFVTPYSNEWAFKNYLFDFWSSVTHQAFCRSSVKKSGQAFYNLGKTVLNTALVPVPPLAEQERIVARIDEIMPLVDKLEIRERERAML